MDGVRDQNARDDPKDNRTRHRGISSKQGKRPPHSREQQRPQQTDSFARKSHISDWQIQKAYSDRNDVATD